jgi:hypothetical protein
VALKWNSPSYKAGDADDDHHKDDHKQDDHKKDDHAPDHDEHGTR